MKSAPGAHGIVVAVREAGLAEKMGFEPTIPLWGILP